MAKQKIYKFSGDFEVIMDGNGVGDVTTLEAFLSKYRNSGRYSTISANGIFTVDSKTLPPQKEWYTRFRNRKAKALESIRQDFADQLIPFWWEDNKGVPDACAVLSSTSYDGSGFVLRIHCSKEDCRCHRYGVPKGENNYWDKQLMTFGENNDPNDGSMVVEVTDLGLDLLAELGHTGIGKKTIVGHLDDKDAVDTIKTTLLGIHNLIGKVKFHD